MPRNGCVYLFKASDFCLVVSLLNNFTLVEDVLEVDSALAVEQDFSNIVTALQAAVLGATEDPTLIRSVFVMGSGAVSVLCQIQNLRGGLSGEFDFACNPREKAHQLPCCDVVVFTVASVRRKPVQSECVRVTFVNTDEESARPVSFTDFVKALYHSPLCCDVLGILLVNALSVAVELPSGNQLDPFCKPLLSKSAENYWKRGSSQRACVLPLGGEPGEDPLPLSLGVRSHLLRTRGRAVLEVALWQASAELRRAVEPPWLLILWSESISYPCSLLTPRIVALVSKIWWWNAFIVGNGTIRGVRDVGPFVKSLDARILSDLRRTVQEHGNLDDFPLCVKNLFRMDSSAAPASPPASAPVSVA